MGSYINGSGLEGRLSTVVWEYPATQSAEPGVSVVTVDVPYQYNADITATNVTVTGVLAIVGSLLLTGLTVLGSIVTSTLSVTTSAVVAALQVTGLTSLQGIRVGQLVTVVDCGGTDTAAYTPSVASVVSTCVTLIEPTNVAPVVPLVLDVTLPDVDAVHGTAYDGFVVTIAGIAPVSRTWGTYNITATNGVIVSDVTATACSITVPATYPWPSLLYRSTGGANMWVLS